MFVEVRPGRAVNGEVVDAMMSMCRWDFGQAGTIGNLVLGSQSTGVKHGPCLDNYVQQPAGWTGNVLYDQVYSSIEKSMPTA